MLRATNYLIWLACLTVHPIVDRLLGEPHFEALVRKMGLDAGSRTIR
jgi:hypothetical protein